MIKDFLNAILAPGKMQQAIEGLREENARLRFHTRPTRHEPKTRRNTQSNVPAQEQSK